MTTEMPATPIEHLSPIEREQLQRMQQLLREAKDIADAVDASLVAYLIMNAWIETSDILDGKRDISGKAPAPRMPPKNGTLN